MVDHSKPRAEQDVGRQSKIYQIEHVEELGSKLEFDGFRSEGSLFHQGDIEVVKTGSPKGVSAQSPETAIIRP